MTKQLLRGVPYIVTCISNYQDSSLIMQLYLTFFHFKKKNTKHALGTTEVMGENRVTYETKAVIPFYPFILNQINMEANLLSYFSNNHYKTVGKYCKMSVKHRYFYQLTASFFWPEVAFQSKRPTNKIRPLTKRSSARWLYPTTKNWESGIIQWVWKINI